MIHFSGKQKPKPVTKHGNGLRFSFPYKDTTIPNGPLVCLMGNCTWKLRAVRRDEGTYFQVRSFINEHTCPLEEIHRRHRQASAVIIGEVIAPRLQQQDGRLMRLKDIITDMKSMYGIQIMYSKAHAALDYTLSLTYGTHEETFQLLPSFGYVLEQKNPGTITDLQYDKDGFRTCMGPVITVDGTHLKGRFRGIMFVATAQNGNEQVYPLAFGYGDSEKNLSWEWFLDCLKGALGHIDELVFISNRHPSIEARIYKVFPYATHTICCWHFTENIKKRFHRKDVTVIIDKAARAYTKFEYNRHMEELSNLHQNAYDYVIDACPHKWSRVHCPKRREPNLDLTTLCSDYYKRQTLIDAYSVPIMPVGDPSTWVVPSNITQRVVLNPNSKRQTGRPRAGRHVSSSERTTSQSCKRCGQPGHNSKRCSNPPMINECPSRGVLDEYHRKCSICHSIGHNKQTCPNIDSNRE
ncbi:hypothetical protein Ddye_001674 [Dipteronia dyeriana]|uniref:CCHC-type domain-containing protein n=1 Tax=Dipteronia dyeriana TaxID=168575 RepID=A0AAE0CTL6_9ROSI|nr:hypothetical protein Ddye_001674 [Dipteronia dyeriana]